MKRLILAIAILIVNTIFVDMKRSECPSCSTPVRPASKFCAFCGRDLNKLSGMQIGSLRNDAGENSSGVQIGIVNKMGKNSKGLQLGLINWLDESCFPLLNMRF